MPILRSTPLLLLAALMLSGCWWSEYNWRQKLTVEVETPQGLATGASVVEVKASFNEGAVIGNEVNYDIHGEATVVEVAPGKYLFALLSGSQERFYRAVRNHSSIDGKSRGEWLDIIPNMRGDVQLESDNYPMLVTFTDINDPATVKQVDPDYLGDSFGPGVYLRRITLSITDEPVTKGKVEAVLGWLDDSDVMENPGWKRLPIEARRAIGSLLTNFPKPKGSE